MRIVNQHREVFCEVLNIIECVVVGSHLLPCYGGGNRAAAFDVDVSKDAIGGLGSPLGFANFVAVDIEFQFDLISGVSEPAVCNSVVFSVRQENDTLVG